MDPRLVICLLCSVFPLQLALAKRNYDIVMTTLDCRIVAPQYIGELDCQIVRQRRPMLAARFSLLQDIENFNITATFDLIKKDNSRMNVANFKMDGCKYLGSMYQSNIVGRLFARLKSVSNLPTSCPVNKGKLFEIRNYTFAAEEFPPGVPQAKWQVRAKLLKRSELAVDIFIEGAVVYNT